MRRQILALLVALVAGLASAQETPAYSTGENPFQGDYAFTPGKPVTLRVVVDGVRLDELTLNPLAEPRAGDKTKCDALMTGSNTTDKKPTLSAVLLLEDADGKNLGRITLDPFKVKANKPFQESQKTTVAGDALIAAKKAYVLIQVDFSQ